MRHFIQCTAHIKTSCCGPLKLELVKDWTADTHWPRMQPGSQRPHTRLVLLIVTLLIAQALATAAYRLFGFDTVGLHAGNFLKIVIFFVMTTRIDIKPYRCPAHGRHASVCKISPSYDAAFRGR